MVAPQQHREVVEPGNDPLQLDPVHEEDRDRRLILADVIEKHVLQVLALIGGHGSYPLLLAFCYLERGTYRAGHLSPPPARGV